MSYSSISMTVEVVGSLLTTVSVLGRSDKLVFTVVVVLWRLCSRVSEPGMS